MGADDWIKWTKGLPQKREVIAIATTLKIDRRMAAALCMQVWEWADNNTVDGDVRGVTKTFLDELVGVPGFGVLMEREHWLVESPLGIVFPNFAYHNGETAKSRALTSRRMARHRATKQRTSDADVTLAASPEKRREERSELKRERGAGRFKKIADTAEVDGTNPFNGNGCLPRRVTATGGATLPDTPEWRLSILLWGGEAQAPRDEVESLRKMLRQYPDAEVEGFVTKQAKAGKKWGEIRDEFWEARKTTAKAKSETKPFTIREGSG